VNDFRDEGCAVPNSGFNCANFNGPNNTVHLSETKLGAAQCPARMLQWGLYTRNVAGGPVMNKLPPPSPPPILHHHFDLRVLLRHASILRNTRDEAAKAVSVHFIIISRFVF
jgi:hypothetical protein